MKFRKLRVDRPAPLAARMRDEAAARGRRVLVVDAERADTPGSLFAALARDLALGADFGANFDALEEALSDLAAEPGERTLVLVTGEDLGGRETKLLQDVLGAVADARFEVVWLRASPSEESE